jgi:hypothetical protein
LKDFYLIIHGTREDPVNYDKMFGIEKVSFNRQIKSYLSDTFSSSASIIEQKSSLLLRVFFVVVFYFFLCTKSFSFIKIV